MFLFRALIGFVPEYKMLSDGGLSNLDFSELLFNCPLELKLVINYILGKFLEHLKTYFKSSKSLTDLVSGSINAKSP